MAHSTEIVETKKLSNGLVAVNIRCCGDSSTDHWHTMHVSVASDPDKRKASIDEQRIFVSNQHEMALSASDAMVGEVAAPPIYHP